MADTGFTSRRNLALGLLIICVLAVLIGVVQQERELALLASRPTPEEEDAQKPGIVKAFRTFKGKALAHIVLDGPIEMKLEEGMLGEKASNAVKVRQALDAAAEDDHIQGVLLSVNSPGGTVGMSQELHAAIERLRKIKPVVAHFGDIAASGGYYTGVAADRIVANPGTLTASIGVIISGLNFHDLMVNKLGVKANVITSGVHKDMLSPYRDPSASDIALLKAIVMDSYASFLGVVVDGRTKHVKDPAEKARRAAIIREVADGRVVTGNQALSLYLVDKLGDIPVAQKELDTLVRARFDLPPSDKPMPLESYSTGDNLLNVIRLPFGAQLPGGFMEALVNRMIPVAAMPTASMPLSAKYPRQPLWILE